MVKHDKFHVVVGVLSSRLAIGVLALLLVGAIVVSGISMRSRAASQTTTAAQASQATPTQAMPVAAPATASIQLAAHELTPSAHFNLTAAGFAAKEQLVLSAMDADGVTYDVGTLQTDAHGNVTSSTLAPPNSLASGSYTLVASGSTSHRTASAPFRMHDIPPALKMENYYGTPGQSIKFSGNGFFPGETVNAYLGTSKTALASTVATDLGAVSGDFAIPSMAAGPYDFSLVGTQSQVPATVRFTIQGFKAWVVLDRYALTPGQSVGFIGHGFAASEQVFAYLNSTKTDPVLRLQADTAGQVVVQDSWVPDAPVGENTLTLIGQSSQASATAQFTIMPSPDQAPATAPAPAPATP